MSIYVKTNDGAEEIQDTYSRLAALEYYTVAGATQICSDVNANLRYMYFQRYGKVVTVVGTIGIIKFPGIRKTLTLGKIKAARWLPRIEGVQFPCVNLDGIGFDISIGTDGLIIFNQRNFTHTESSSTWMTGTVTYICN